MSVLREVAEALEGKGFEVEGFKRLTVLDPPAGCLIYPPLSAEDILQCLPEHLWERVSVTRVAPGRFVLEVLLVLLLFALPGAAQTITGKVSKVTDGDTLRVGQVAVRLHGIDAPEDGQTCQRAGKAWDCGAAAESLLARLAPLGAAIRCDVTDTDRYGRLVGRCFVTGKDLGREVVAAGLAVAFTRYSRDYEGIELEAARAGRGMWAGTFVRPEEYRAAKRGGR